MPDRPGVTEPLEGFTCNVPSTESGISGVWSTDKVMYYKGDKELGTIMPLLSTGSTRTILDRTAPEPVDPNDPSWVPVN